MSARKFTRGGGVGMSDHSHGAEAAFRRWGHAAEREAQRKGRVMNDLFPREEYPEAHAPEELHDGDQRFTTPECDQWCRKVAGVDAWDLDVAACDEAHLAPTYFTKAMNGLLHRWVGRVWCNPPFSDIGPWVLKAWAAMVNREADLVAMLLPASRTEQEWWQSDVEAFRDRVDPPTEFGAAALVRWDAFEGAGVRLRTRNLPGRTRFGHPGNPTGKGVGSPPFGCVLLVWRRA